MCIKKKIRDLNKNRNSPKVPIPRFGTLIVLSHTLFPNPTELSKIGQGH